MTTLARRNSSIHKVREFSLPKVNLEAEYEVVAVLQEGWRGRLLLVEHRLTRNEVVLKAAHKDATSRLEFFREFHYNYYLSPHRNILNAYDVAFIAGDYYMFAQELAPFGDLTSNTSDTGIGEINTKKIACQLASALDFMHSKDLVHRDINMDNVLVFKSDFSRVKLCDFGSTRKTSTLLKKKTVWLPYAPPEIVDAVQNEGYHVDTAQDVWQFGILIYVLLTGLLPWQKADLTDPHYAEYINWRKRRTLRTPKRLSNFTTRFLRLMKRTLEPKPEKRASVKEVLKYINDKWLVRLIKRDDGDVDNQSVCYSTYSMHSSKLEKDKVLKALKDHGIETTVDRAAKRKRIHEWLERSITTRQLVVEEDNPDGEKTPTIIETPSSPLLLSKGPDLKTKLKLSNMSSMNNILDDGYQTGSSSNNSSIKVNQLHTSLTKSTGNIDTIKNDRLYNANAQFVIQRIQEQRRGSQNQAQEAYSITKSPTRLSGQPLQGNLSETRGVTHQDPQPRSGQPPEQPPVSGIPHPHHSTKDHNQLVREHNQLINQQQMRHLNSQFHQYSNSYQNSKGSTPADAQQHSGISNQQSVLGSVPSQPSLQQQQYFSVVQQTCVNSTSGSSGPLNASQGRSRPLERLQHNTKANFELQRSRTDSYFVTDSPSTSVSQQTSDEGLSDGSVNSVILRMNTVGT